MSLAKTSHVSSPIPKGFISAESLCFLNYFIKVDHSQQKTPLGEFFAIS